ncbi:response regulator transcription factor [Bengtsoniella intestinalis]|uniref:response regulator transcription factor n=1 Tax=Bengtsoniella intestinalis TaxID=3073143 RepID=UPI00391F02F4
MYHILICDDDTDIATTLGMYLRSEGYLISTASNGLEALDILQTQDIHLILMDIMMPKMDGLSATAKLREFSNAPVIMLTAKSEDTDLILGLNMGADDYITKPYRPTEVMARVKSHLRRYAQLGGMTAPKEGSLTVGEIALDDEAKTVTLRGEEVNVTPTEYSILKFLMENPNKVYNSKALYTAVWGQSPMGAEGSVAVHIRHLREKLEVNPSEPRYLKVVWGQGYKLEKLEGKS